MMYDVRSMMYGDVCMIYVCVWMMMMMCLDGWGCMIVGVVCWWSTMMCYAVWGRRMLMYDDVWKCMLMYVDDVWLGLMVRAYVYGCCWLLMIMVIRWCAMVYVYAWLCIPIYTVDDGWCWCLLTSHDGSWWVLMMMHSRCLVSGEWWRSMMYADGRWVDDDRSLWIMVWCCTANTMMIM